MLVSAETGSILNFAYNKLTAFNGYGVGTLSGLVVTTAWIIVITF